MDALTIEGAWMLALVAMAGFACGFLNTAASSGSAVSLPILVFIGLDPLAANATNRIPVLVGALAAAASFHRKALINWPMAFRIAVPTTLGALLGAGLAEMIPSREFALVVTAAIVPAFLLLLTKVKRILATAALIDPRWRWTQVAWFFGIGVWLGLIVIDGATYLLLALVLSVGLPLIQSNAIKSVLLIPTTLVALLVFTYEGQVAWGPGGVMALGSIMGGVAGPGSRVRCTARNGSSICCTSACTCFI